MKKYVIAGVLVLAVVVYIIFANEHGTPAAVTNTPSSTGTGTSAPSESTNPAIAAGAASGASASSSGTGTPSTTPQFTVNLGFGSTGADVSALQQILINDGYLTAVSAPTGYFGPLTQAAVVIFQTANDIAPAVGYFGPLTRASINSAVAVGTSGNPSGGASTSGQYKDGTYTGPVENAVYGNIQVVVTVSGGKITTVAVPVFPDSPGHSSQVSASAIPKLQQEALTMQSANVNVVSGATQDSQAFQQSLAAALATANN